MSSLKRYKLRIMLIQRIKGSMIIDAAKIRNINRVLNKLSTRSLKKRMYDIANSEIKVSILSKLLIRRKNENLS